MDKINRFNRPHESFVLTHRTALEKEVAAQVAIELRQKGHRVKLISTRGQFPSPAQRKEVQPHASAQILSMRKIGFRNPTAHVLAIQIGQSARNLIARAEPMWESVFVENRGEQMLTGHHYADFGSMEVHPVAFEAKQGFVPRMLLRHVLVLDGKPRKGTGIKEGIRARAQIAREEILKRLTNLSTIEENLRDGKGLEPMSLGNATSFAYHLEKPARVERKERMKYAHNNDLPGYREMLAFAVREEKKRK